ncbi:ATP-dependent translocase ABCB1-like isoform X1 [Diorhabda sublineata]|uniref:ATP-dependent translocase ABCB1-like isoform X1 n=1 Tax=Diorhabda sublineata TaxID=1163346 RepID=UPI0024E14B33|nr:ATP-dependent translocase ABCB1-like isoform X1 [Diorhabda sublineata]
MIENKCNKKEEANESEDKATISYFRLFEYATTLDKVCMLFGGICSICSGVAQPLAMILFGDVTGCIIAYASLYNNSLTQDQKDSLTEDLNYGIWKYGIQTFGIGLGVIITTYLSMVLFSYSAVQQILKIRKQFFEKTLNQDIAWFDMNRTGDFATTFTHNISKIEDGIGDKIGTFLFFESSFVAGIILSLAKGWKLALVCMVSLPLSTILMALISWVSTKFSEEEMESYGAAGAIAEEVLSSIKTVVAFDGQQKELTRYDKHLINAKKNNLKRGFFNALSNGCLWFFVYACYALSFWYGVKLILEERHLPPEKQIYTPANMISVFFSTLTATWNFGMGAPLVEIFGTAKGAAHKIFAVIDSAPIIKKDVNVGRTLTNFSKDITFENVYFDYPSRPDVKILRGFNLKINIGETVALVGSSGCGKSTCIQLLQRFYDPVEGRIKIDDIDIKDFNLDWMKRKIAVVSQEPALFGTTIAENIRYGRLNATQLDIEEAAKKANAHKFICALPHGYQTVIGERGAQLSGGQKQRIAIARALVRRPEILLLDEATSALDTTSEAEVQAALDSISGTCTTIIVAHRLSTIRNAHRIVFINQGIVSEIGTHAELIDKKGSYYNMVVSQGITDVKECKGDEEITGAFNAGNKLITEEAEQREKEETISDVQQSAVKKILWKIMEINASDWHYIVLGCLSSLVTGACLPIYAVVFGGLIGVFANNDDEKLRSESNIYCLYFLIIGIVTGSAMFIQMLTFSIAGEGLTMKIRHRTFATMLKQEISWYDRKENGVGALCAQLASDAVSVQGIAGVQIGTILNFMSTFILTFAFSFYFEWSTTLVLMSVCPLIFFSIYFEQKIMQEDARKNQKMLEKSSKLAVETISNIRTVVSLGCEAVFLDNFVKELLPYLKIARKKSHFRGVVLGMARSLMLFAYAAGMKYGSTLIISGKSDYGTIFTVNEVMIIGTWYLGNSMSLSPNFQKGFTAASRIISLLERVPTIRNIPNPLKSLWEDETIKYSQIHFSYPTRPSVPILNALNLKVPKGKTVALVGSSGCGKSTIIQLLERFYDPSYGEIIVNETDTRKMNLQTLRTQLGIVSQEPNLFDTTLAENIAYGANHLKLDMSAIVEAAKCANIHNFISSLPLGYETKVGNKGTQLSGGQKQRVAIARALVRNPKILLLDEATSALDNESEKVVQEALDNARQGRTCITIAHRLTTIQDADIICVLDGGFVVEMGTHDDLLEKRGLYYKFYKLQSVKY